MEQSTNEAADLMFGETDRFLEEVLLSRGPQRFGAHDPHTKNDFFPKKQANALPVVGEMSIQDLSSHDITSAHDYDDPDRTVNKTKVCNKTLDCSCGCQDDSYMKSQVNRTYQDARDMRKQRELRQFYANINTEIASCTQDDEDESCDYRRPNHQPSKAADSNANGFAESRATNKDDDEGSPARLLEQLLASQGASAFQP